MRRWAIPTASHRKCAQLVDIPSRRRSVSAHTPLPRTRQPWQALPDDSGMPPLRLARRGRLDLSAYAVGTAAVPDVYYIPDFLDQVRRAADPPSRARVRAHGVRARCFCDSCRAS